VYSQEGYQIDYFPPFPAHLIWLVGINIKRNTHEYSGVTIFSIENIL
jgi:hypothetical protein